MIKVETVATAVKVFSVKSNASRAAKAFIAKHGENGLFLYNIAAVEGGFEVQVTARAGHAAADLEAAGFRLVPRPVETAGALPVAPTAEELLAKVDAQMERADALIAKADAALAADTISEEAVDAALEARFSGKAVEEVAPQADADVEAVSPPAAAKTRKRAAKAPVVNSADEGVCEGFEEARDAGAARYGYTGKTPNFIAERGKGGWVWGPLPTQAPKADKPAAGVAKAAQGKRAEVIEAAKRGELPTPPDFSAALHERNRPKLAKLVEMAKAGDIEGLKAFPIKPNCTSPKAMDRYRNLAVMALEARASA